MSYPRSILWTLSTAIGVLIVAALTCSAPGVNVPPTVTPVVFPTATVAPEPAAATATPPSSPTSVPPTPVPSTPTATALPTAKTKDRTNIRSGPGTDYALLGFLAPGLSVKLIGRNADKSWWQIEFPSSPDGYAWVLAANLDTSASSGADDLPVASAPPRPTRPPASATAPGAPDLIPVLRADKTQLTAGECTTLRWDVENVDSVFLDSGSGEAPVIGHDARWICPDATMLYTLRAVNKDKTSEKKFKLTVTVSPCGDTPVISRFEASALEVKAGTSVTLAWDVACAQAVYFKAGSGDRQDTTGHDHVQVQPTQTTTYRLIVAAKNGSEIKRDITIKVVP